MEDSSVNNPENTPISGAVEVVQDDTKSILTNIDLYLQYIRQELKQIIIDDDLHYSEPMEKKKTYPDFTYIQFCYLFDDSYIYKRVYSIPKVELCYKVYSRLCGYYGFICSVEQFEVMTGIDEGTLKEWLSCGKSDLFNFMLKNAKNNVVSSFENSKVPLLKLASANYKYKLQTPLEEREQQAAVEVLPDLLTIAQDKKALPGAEN